MANGFGAASTTDAVLEGVDLSDKRILVTGVSAGLGVETARALISRGAQVIGAARDLGKARLATAEIVHDGRLDLIEVDLGSLASIRTCTSKLLADGRELNVIIANAGVMACPQGTTSDGFETQFGVNHLGHFLLVNRIAPLLRPGGRLVSLASRGHRLADVDLEDPNFERQPYVEFLAYGRSKSANVLFAVEFDRRHQARGVRATAVHPGSIRTELGRHLTADVTERFMAAASQGSATAPEFDWKSIPQGAATSVWAGLVAPADAVGGRYCEDCHVAEVNDSPAFGEGVRSYALDPDRARALWTLSEALVGETF